LTSDMSKSQFLAFLRRFMLDPVLVHRSELVVVGLSLAFLAVTQGLAILLMKGFLAAFFQDVSAASVPLDALLPRSMVQYVPGSSNIELARGVLALWIPVGIVMTGVLKALATYIYNLGLTRMALRVAQNYREHVFAGILELPWLSSGRRDPGEWMSVIMADALFIQSRLTDFSTAFIKDGVLILACILTLALIHWPAALVLLALAPLIGWQMGRAGRRIAWFTEAFQRELGVLSGILLGMRERFRYMRAQSGEAFEVKQFRRANDAYLNMMSGSIFLRALVAPGMEWVGFVVFAVFIYGWTNKINGFSLSPDVVVQFFVALGLILRPVRELGEQVARWSETIGGLRRSMAVMAEVDLNRQYHHAGSVTRATMPFKSMTVNRVRISYGPRTAFKADDLHLDPGTTVAIIGPSGAGKSTILKALSGLINPDIWDSDVKLSDVVACSSLVSQSPFLFKDTLKGNLLYGLEESIRVETTDEMLWAALRIVNLETALRALPHGLESTFNPLETNLSGGQIQRLVIARALLRRRPMLILDEATSAVDGATEKDISERLIATAHATGTTLIAVTHRLRWLASYDDVWFVEDGQIKAKGRHLSLMEQDRYRQFVTASHAAGEVMGL
jgi:ABC-type multidrug transport system fused ATPase/permease subunit